MRARPPALQRLGACIPAQKVRFLPGSRPAVSANRVVIEAADPPAVLRCVEFASGEDEEGLDVLAPIVVEGVLIVRYHPGSAPWTKTRHPQVLSALRASRKKRPRGPSAASPGRPRA